MNLAGGPRVFTVPATIEGRIGVKTNGKADSFIHCEQGESVVLLPHKTLDACRRSCAQIPSAFGGYCQISDIGRSQPPYGDPAVAAVEAHAYTR